MEIQNSLVIADYIRGAFIPLGCITAACGIAFIFLLFIGTVPFEEENRKLWGSFLLLCAP